MRGCVCGGVIVREDRGCSVAISRFAIKNDCVNQLSITSPSLNSGCSVNCADPAGPTVLLSSAATDAVEKGAGVEAAAKQSRSVSITSVPDRRDGW